MFPKLLETVAKPVAPSVVVNSKRGDARMLLERVLNQNEQALGLFYLHPDADIGLGEPGVAFLRVMVSLRAQHYDALRAARTCHLDPRFRGKFGWLLGNLYARAASPDWADQPDGKKVMEAVIQELMDGPAVHWLDDEVVTAAVANGVSLDSENFSDLRERLEELRPPRPVDQVAGIVTAEADKVIQSKGGSLDLRVLGNRLRNNGHLAKLLRRLRPVEFDGS